ncbi:MAG TPA: ArsR family transcriptional regulator, partial [Erythrobacter sp.]|nr:ArsR family transcriptional regulator [Erythrobacter sp.]
LLSDAGFDPAAPTALEDGELVVKIWIAPRRVDDRKAAS